MNRRSFMSLLAGAAGAPLVPWRGLIAPLIVLPPRPHICDSPWCNHPAHAQSKTPEEIYADVRRICLNLNSTTRNLKFEQFGSLDTASNTCLTSPPQPT